MKQCDGWLEYSTARLRNACRSIVNFTSLEVLLTYRMGRAGFVTALSDRLPEGRLLDGHLLDDPGAVTRPAAS